MLLFLGHFPGINPHGLCLHFDENIRRFFETQGQCF